MNYYDYTMLDANNYRVTQVTAPLITLTELKNHLQLYEDDFDTHFSTVIIPAATEIINSICGEFSQATSVSAFYETFATRIRLPHEHVATITSVNYYNDMHTLTLLPTSDYVFDTTTRNEVVFTGNLPEVSGRFRNPVIVAYSAAVSASEVNTELFVQATLMVASELWYNKGDTYEAARTRAAYTAQQLLAPYTRVLV